MIFLCNGNQEYEIQKCPNLIPTYVIKSYIPFMKALYELLSISSPLPLKRNSTLELVTMAHFMFVYTAIVIQCSHHHDIIILHTRWTVLLVSRHIRLDTFLLSIHTQYAMHTVISPKFSVYHLQFVTTMFCKITCQAFDIFLPWQIIFYPSLNLFVLIL